MPWRRPRNRAIGSIGIGRQPFPIDRTSTRSTTMYDVVKAKSKKTEFNRWQSFSILPMIQNLTRKPRGLSTAPVRRRWRINMSVAKIIEISCESPKSFEDAIQDGIAKASKTVHNIKSAWVKEQHAAALCAGDNSPYSILSARHSRP